MKHRSLFELAEQIKMEYEEQERRERPNLAAKLSSETAGPFCKPVVYKNGPA